MTTVLAAAIASAAIAQADVPDRIARQYTFGSDPQSVNRRRPARTVPGHTALARQSVPCIAARVLVE
jgi:hypothetical protein